MTFLSQLPEREWGVLRDVPRHLVFIFALAGLIKVQVTPTPDVWQARLTGPGRTYRREQS